MFEVLTENQWALLEPLFPNPVKRGRGKPHAPWRNIVNSILYILSTGSKWEALPKQHENPLFAPKSVAHRWFLRWEREGFLPELFTRLGASLETQEAIANLPRRKRTPKEALSDA
jgi:transposase